MQPLTVSLEFGMSGGAFAGSGFASGAFGGSEWVNILPDVRASEPIVLEYGIHGSDPTALVSESGTLQWSLNNGAWNSNATQSWYSPLHAMRRGGFDFNIPTRLTLSSGSNTITKFLGRLADILVTPGVHEDRMVRCVAYDLMEDYGRLPVPPLETQFGKRGDELLQMVLDALPNELQPQARSISTGLETYDIAFDRAREDSMTIRELIHEICISEMATAGFIGTPDPAGGLFVFYNRQTSAFNTIVVHNFDDDILRGGLVVPGSRDDLVSKVQVFAHPTQVDPAPIVLYDLQTTSTFIGPSGVNAFLFGPYRDPENPGDRVGGTDMIQPEPTTDFLMNSAQDGSGADLTGNFTVSASYTSSGVRFTITNTGAVGGYVTKLQARGRGVYRVTAMIEADVPSVAYGHRVLQVDMPYQNNTNVANDVASYLTNSLSRVYARVTSITFLANDNPQLMSSALALEPGKRIAITEEMTGLVDAVFTINGVRLEIVNAAQSPALFCTWHLKPADTQQYWFAGTVGASEAGVTTVPGY